MKAWPHPVRTFKEETKNPYMTSLALLLVLPLLWPIAAKHIWKHELTLGELGVNLGIGVLVAALGWLAGTYGPMTDTQVLNGEVTGKESRRVSCEHSYSCNCQEVCSGSGDSRSCSQVCQTCYDHDYDVDWILHTNLSDIEIDRVNRQGTQEPPRYSRAIVGDPVAQTNWYLNYIKAAPDSLFNIAAEQKAYQRFAAKVPAYPLAVHDYHYLNRVIPVGLSLPDQAEWNLALALRLRTLGPSHQLNVVVVLVNEADPTYAAALRAAWLGGKKNDVVVVLGVPQYPAVAWADVISWTDKTLFKVQLRDALAAMPAAAPDTVLPLIEQHIRAGYVRKPMEDFAYLKYQIEPPMWALILLAVLSTSASVATSLVLSRNRHRVR